LLSRINRENFVEKYYFSGIFEIDQANFCGALIFWSFLIKQKGHEKLFVPTLCSPEGESAHWRDLCG